MQRAVIRGPLVLQFPGKFRHAAERLADRGRRLRELFLTELAVGADGGLQVLHGLTGGVFVGLPRLLIAFGGGGVGDVLDVGARLVAAEPLAGPEADEVEDGGDQSGPEECEEEHRDSHDGHCRGRI